MTHKDWRVIKPQHNQICCILNGPAAKKRDLRTLCEQRRSRPACKSPQTGQDLRCSPTQYRDLGGWANWSRSSPFVYALRAFLSAGGPNTVSGRRVFISHKKAVSHVINSRALTSEKPWFNKAIHALLIHGYATFNMIVPGPQICCR